MDNKKSGGIIMGLYLVTGAAGFIGAAVARKLISLGNEVVTIDNLSTGSRETIPEKVRFIEGGCHDKKIVSLLGNSRFDAILHIAGQSSGEISFDDPVYDLQTNTQSTLLLLKFAQKTGCGKFIYASSMSVYGDQPDLPTSETVPVIPKSFYAVGKLASENYLRIFSNYGISAVSLRLFNVYGPGQNMGNLRQGMVSIFLAQAISNRHIHVKGSPERYRDLLYIEDAVDSFLRAINFKCSYDVFNVGTGIKTSVGELVSKIRGTLPFEVTVEYSGSTLGDQFGIYADNRKLSGQFGWSPRYPLDEGLMKMIAWALKDTSRADIKK